MAVALTCMASIAFAQGLKAAKPTLKVGNWTVLRSIDAMTDKVSCTGIYKSNYGIQLSANKLYVNISGGIQSVTLRFGENPPENLRLPQKMEKDVRAVIIEGSEFQNALATNRLRLQVLTLVRGVTFEDIDTTGIKSAVEHIQAGCPLPTEAGSAESALGTCPSEMVTKLRASGLTEDQILKACGP